MNNIVEKIKSAETESAKLIADAEINGKSLVSNKKDEIAKLEAGLDLQVKKILDDAKIAGENDARGEIEKLTQETDTRIEQISQKFVQKLDSLIEKVIEEI